VRKSTCLYAQSLVANERDSFDSFHSKVRIRKIGCYNNTSFARDTRNQSPVNQQ